jgi:hypothetical protein
LPKPVLLGSVSPGPTDWSEVSSAGVGVWGVNISAIAAFVVAGAGPAGNAVTDVGNLVLAGRAAGERKLGRKVWSASELQLPFDFFFDRKSKTLLLKSPTGKNPSLAVAPSSIECALMWLVCHERISGNRCAPPALLPSNALVGSAHISNVVFQDLALRYAGGTGFGATHVRGVTVQRCEIRWIGGGTRYVPATDPDCARGTCVRFGNGIEFWMGAADVNVGHNRVDQVYDAALTNQGGGGFAYNQSNIWWHDNVVSRSEWCFEIWDDSPRNRSSMHNIRFQNNSCTNSGGGWSNAVRPIKLSTHIKMGRTTGRVANISITGNRFSQNVPISAAWSMFDSPYGGSSANATSDAGGWGHSITTDWNLWCQRDATLGPFLVVGCIPGPVRPCVRIKFGEFEQYRELSHGNGAHSHWRTFTHSHVVQGPCDVMPTTSMPLPPSRHTLVHPLTLKLDDNGAVQTTHETSLSTTPPPPPCRGCPWMPPGIIQTPKNDDILVKNPSRLPARLPVITRQEGDQIGEMYDYKPSIAVLHHNDTTRGGGSGGGNELLMVFRHQNGSDPGTMHKLHAIFMRSHDGGQTWGERDESQTQIVGGEFSLHTLSDGSVLLLSPVVIWRSVDGGLSFPNNTGLPNAGQGTIVPWDTGNVTFTSGLAYTAIEVLPAEVVAGGLPVGVYFFGMDAILRSTDFGRTVHLHTAVTNMHWQRDNAPGYPGADNTFFGKVCDPVSQRHRHRVLLLHQELVLLLNCTLCSVQVNPRSTGARTASYGMPAALALMVRPCHLAP